MRLSVRQVGEWGCGEHADVRSRAMPRVQRPISTRTTGSPAERRRDPVGDARRTAFLRLAAAILARTVGIRTDVAVAWQCHSAGDWAGFAVDVSLRPGPALAQHLSDHQSLRAEGTHED